ncbi:MAG: DUF1624 domain-containing protein [Verrucomicrobia bacterium]|nr:DUF1624 domain-containing protein [Verrucomicrobiota bacterium]
MNPPAPAMDSTPVAPSAAGRVVSVDALRGFDMFWIIGAGSLVQALDKMSGNGVTRFLSAQLKHVPWEGFRFYDLIFPLFLFIVGVSLVFSLDKALARDGLGAALKRIAGRSLLLYLLGVFYSGGLTNRWPDISLGGVLHRIAACYFFAATIYCCCAARPKTMAGIAVALLTGYWALLALVPFPDFKIDQPTVTALARQIGSDSASAIAGAVKGRVSGLFEEGRNLTNYFDFLYFYVPGRRVPLYYINEGLLSTLPAISICLFGAFAGRLLKEERVKPIRKVTWLLAAGAALVVLGLFWSLQFPLIKRIWTSSFCVVTTGCSAMLLGVFYFVVDVCKFQTWCQPFVWIGMNSITIYLTVSVVSLSRLAERFVGGDVRAFLDAHVANGFGGLVVTLAGLALAVLLCWFLHRNKIFLRV